MRAEAEARAYRLNLDYFVGEVMLEHFKSIPAGDSRPANFALSDRVFQMGRGKSPANRSWPDSNEKGKYVGDRREVSAMIESTRSVNLEASRCAGGFQIDLFCSKSYAGNS